MIIVVRDDYHAERPGFYRAYWTDSLKASTCATVVGYCSGGSHKTIRSAVAECRKLGYDEPAYRNGRRLSY